MDRILTVTDYYDGPVEGLTTFEGKTHMYKCIFDEDRDEYSKRYYLMPISSEIEKLLLEQWAIFCRWNTAFKNNEVEANTHPALPEDFERNAQIDFITKEKVKIKIDKCKIGTANFEVPKKPNWAAEWNVKWV